MIIYKKKYEKSENIKKNTLTLVKKKYMYKVFKWKKYLKIRKVNKIIENILEAIINFWLVFLSC